MEPAAFARLFTAAIASEGLRLIFSSAFTFAPASRAASNALTTASSAARSGDFQAPESLRRAASEPASTGHLHGQIADQLVHRIVDQRLPVQRRRLLRIAVVAVSSLPLFEILPRSPL
nr:hypothetical protein [Prescottella equi]